MIETTAKDWIIGIGIALAIIGILALILLFIFHNIRPGPKDTPIFHVGQVVKMRQFGNVGMIVDSSCRPIKWGGGCYYDVRFASLQLTTDTHFLGSDGPIEFAPVALVRNIREFELEGK